jgi:hypothetical protein
MLLRIAFVLLTLTLLSLGSWPSSAQQPVGATPLRLVPDDAILYVHLKGNALWNNPAFEEVKKRLPAEKWKKIEQELFQVSEQVTGIARRDVESVTIMLHSWDVPQVPGFAMVIQSRIPLKPKQFTTSIKKYFDEKMTTNRAPYSNKTIDGIEVEQITNLQGKALSACQLDSQTGVIGDDETLKKLIQRSRANVVASFAQTAATTEIALGLQVNEDLRNQLSALLDMAMAAPRREGNDAYNAGVSIATNLFRALTDVKQLKLEGQLLRDLAINLQVEANSEPAAIRFQRLMDALALLVDFGLHSVHKIADKKDHELYPFRKLFAALSEASLNSKVTRQGNQVTMSLNAPGSGQEFSLAMAGIISKMGGMQQRVVRQNNLRQMAIAMHNYHNDYNRLPSAGYYTGSGMMPQKDPRNPNSKLGLSWRVAILPYLEQDNLFKQFHHNEPWDSEHNKKFIAMMPKIYAVPGVDAESGLTHYQVFVAPEKPTDPAKQRFAPMFTPGKPLTLGQLTVMDGTSNTIMIAEAAKPVIWTKPEDMEIAGDDTPLPKLGVVPDEDDVFVVFGDASVRTLKRSLPDAKEYEKLMRQLIGRRDGMNDNTDPIMVDAPRRPTSKTGTFEKVDRPVEKLENRK